MSGNFLGEVFRTLVGDERGRRRLVMPCVATLLVILSSSAAFAQEATTATTAGTDTQVRDNQAHRRVEINLRPLSEVLSKAKRMREAGTLDLDGTFDMVVEADRTQDGTLENLTIGKASGNREFIGLAEEFVRALGESKLFGMLEYVSHIKMTFKVNEQNVSLDLVSEVESETRAAQMATGYGALLNMARMSKKGKEEVAVWESLKASTTGKQVAFTFSMPRATFGRLLARAAANR